MAAALAFHAATHALMGIDFSVLWTCYTVFVPWEALLRRARIMKLGAPRERDDTAALRRLGLAASALVLGVSIAGATGAMQAYPFACYPTFQWMATDRMPALAIELEGADGARVAVAPFEYREAGPRGWALEWRLVGAYDDTIADAIEVNQRSLLGIAEQETVAEAAKEKVCTIRTRRGAEVIDVPIACTN